MIRVARLQQRVVDGRVGLRARVRLDVRVLGAEQRLRAVDRELLDHVDELAAAVVALARIALGVLVGQHASPDTPGRPGARSSLKRSSPACAAGARARGRSPRPPRGRPRRADARSSRAAERSCSDRSESAAVASEVSSPPRGASPTQGGRLVGMVRGHLQVHDLMHGAPAAEHDRDARPGSREIRGRRAATARCLRRPAGAARRSPSARGVGRGSTAPARASIVWVSGSSLARSPIRPSAVERSGAPTRSGPPAAAGRCTPRSGRPCPACG